MIKDNIKQRDTNIDFVKGLGIILLILGHISDGDLQRVIYSFHMPLFVIVSGYLFKNPANKKNYIMKCVKDLVYPYVTFNILLILIGLIHLVIKQPVWFFKNTTSAIASIISFLCGRGISVTWFLFFLFVLRVVECLFHDKRMAIILLSILGIGGGVFIPAEGGASDKWNLEYHKLLPDHYPQAACCHTIF